MNPKQLLDSLSRGETNIKHKTIDIKQKTLIANMVSNSPPDRGVELATAEDLCEGPLGPAGKPANTGVASQEKVLVIGSPKPKPLATTDISYAALTLFKANPKKVKDNRQKVNLDFVVNESITFNKLVFSLTQKDSEFYLNLPPDWENTLAYKDAWDLYRGIKSTTKIPTWIGKGCIRQTYKPGKRIKSKMRLETTMVLWRDQGTVSGRCWIESAVFDFEFDQLLDDNKLYLAKSEPFEPPVVWDQSPWL